MLSKKAKTMVIAIPLATVIGLGGYSAFNSSLLPCC